MAKAKKAAKPKQLSVKKNPVGVPAKADKVRKREVPRAREMSFIKPGGTTKKTIVNGIVTAVDGTPLPGISVGLKGVKQKAALSDACGNFAISISDDYIGVLLFGWANNTAGASLDLQLLPKSKAIIVALKAIATYENKNCTKSYKKSKKILI